MKIVDTLIYFGISSIIVSNRKIKYLYDLMQSDDAQTWLGLISSDCNRFIVNISRIKNQSQNEANW